MNSLIKIFLFLIFAVITFSCEDESLTTYYPEKTTAPELTMPASVELTMDNQANELVFSWSQAAYNFPAGITYKFEIAAGGTDFASPYALYSGSALTCSTTVKDLNTAILSKLGLEAGVESAIDFRVISSISPEVNDHSSTVKTLDLTPYQTVFPPIYMIGAATGGWNTALAVEVTSSAPNTYSTIAHFIQNEAFRFFAQPDWSPTSYNYPYFTTVSDKLANALDGDSNFKVLAATGYYRITVNLSAKTVEMTAVEEPLMYMTGAAIGGWDKPGEGASIKMTFVKENVWKATASFTSGDAFRFFAQADWSPVSYNYPYFAGGTVDSRFVNAGDGDSNFEFTGTTGSYLVTLDLNTKTVTLTAP